MPSMMNWLTFIKAVVSGNEEPARSNFSLPLPLVIRAIRPVGSALLTQGMLLLQLARVEWEQERARLMRMVMMSLLASAMLLAMLVFVGAFVLILVWETPYRALSALAIAMIYGGVVWWALCSIRQLSISGDKSFAATREELASDWSLLKRKLML